MRLYYLLYEYIDQKFYIRPTTLPEFCILQITQIFTRQITLSFVLSRLPTFLTRHITLSFLLRIGHTRLPRFFFFYSRGLPRTLHRPNYPEFFTRQIILYFAPNKLPRIFCSANYLDFRTPQIAQNFSLARLSRTLHSPPCPEFFFR